MGEGLEALYCEACVHERTMVSSGYTSSGYTEEPHKDRDDLRNVRAMLPYVWEYRGRVLLGERVLTDTATRTQVPVHNRRIGLMAQSGLLFDHLNVLEKTFVVSFHII